MSKKQLEKVMKETENNMKKAAKQTEFLEAARLRDELFALQNLFKERFGK
jgi:excinuclease ABC subunit B